MMTEPTGTERTGAGGHRRALATSLIALMLPFGLVEVPGGRVAVRGLSDHPLPTTCAARTLLGIRCPGCGLTRSFIRLAEGDWRGSWRSHRLGVPLTMLVIGQIPYRLLAIRRSGPPPIQARWGSAMVVALAALLILNWLADVVTGRLAPL